MIRFSSGFHSFRSGILLLSIFISTSWQQKDTVKLISVKVAELLTVKVPESFQKLTDDQIADKIIASRKPLVMYSNPAGTVDFSVSVGNSSKNPWQDKDLKLMAEFQKANIRQLFTNVDFIQDKQIKIKGHQFWAFEFLSEVKEKGKPPIRKYNNVRYAIHKKNMLIFSFICSEGERAMYQGLSEQILSTIKF
jgi:hypothetical protein